ncbi:TPA: DUF2786 domain-containing protein [Enterobacter cloacae]|nr:DUF2786 domain-containing protein [Enterobacter cloacae]
MNNDKRQERLVSLVRKLLELSRSNSNAHEAGLALSREQRLMEKYGISELDATLSSVREVASQSAPSEAEKVPEWMTRLIWAVGHAFGCRPYFSWRYTPSGDCRRTVTFYGFSERPAVAAYAFEVLTHQLKDATAVYLETQSKKLKLTTRRNRAELFRAGWVEGMRRVITVFRVTEQETQLMTRWMDNQNMKTVTIRELRSCRGGDIARHRGYEAGKNARLHQGVQGENPAAIGYRGKHTS